MSQVTGCPVFYTILNGESLPISDQDCFHFSVVWFVVYCPAVSLMLIFYLFFTLFGMVPGQLVHLYLLKGVCQRNVYSFPYHKLMVLVFVDNLKLYLKKKITETCCNLGSILQLPKYQMNTIKHLFLLFCLL